jgi:hypothetical protein
MTAISQTKKRLQAAIEYFAATRGVGHTKTVIEGIAKNLGSAVIVANENGAREYEKQCVGISAVSIDGFEKLRGQTRPIVFDNHSLIILFTGAFRAIDNLESQAIGFKQSLDGARLENKMLSEKLLKAEARVAALKKEAEAAKEAESDQAADKPEPQKKNLGEAKKISEDKK